MIPAPTPEAAVASKGDWVAHTLINGRAGVVFRGTERECRDYVTAHPGKPYLYLAHRPLVCALPEYRERPARPHPVVFGAHPQWCEDYAPEEMTDAVHAVAGGL